MESRAVLRSRRQGPSPMPAKCSRNTDADRTLNVSRLPLPTNWSFPKAVAPAACVPQQSNGPASCPTFTVR